MTITDQMHEYYLASDLARDVQRSVVSGHIHDDTDVLRVFGNAILNLADRPEKYSIDPTERAYLSAKLYDALIDAGLITRF